MPEEINRRLTDHISTYLFTTSRDADENLAREGIAAERIFFVGNTMIDTLLRFRDAARAGETRRRASALDGRDTRADAAPPGQRRRARAMLGRVLEAVARDQPLRRRSSSRSTRGRGSGSRARARPLLADEPGIIACAPLGYLDFVGLVGRRARSC